MTPYRTKLRYDATTTDGKESTTGVDRQRQLAPNPDTTGTRIAKPREAEPQRPPAVRRATRVVEIPAATTWDSPDIRAALRIHDIAAVFRHLARHGYSQGRIGQLTGMSQPEISAVVHGRRIVTYRTLARIADGLGIPRGLLGLSWCDCPHPQ